MTNQLIFAAIGLFCIFFFLKIKKNLFFYPYKKNKFFFTKNETHFFHLLSKSLGSEFVIMAKVRIADVISVENTGNKRTWFTLFNKIACKHFDYVLLNRGLQIAGVVELDDSSHERADRRERDDFVNKVCKAAKLPLIRIRSKRYYMPNEIKQAVYDALNRSGQQE